DHGGGGGRAGYVAAHQAARRARLLSLAVKLRRVAVVVGARAAEHQHRHARHFDQVAEGLDIAGVGDLQRVRADLNRHARAEREDLDGVRAGDLPTHGERLDDARQPGALALAHEAGVYLDARRLDAVAVAEEQVDGDGRRAERKRLLGGDDLLVPQQPLRDGVGGVGVAEPGHVHPVGADDQRRAIPPLKERREPPRHAGAEQDAIHPARNDGFDDLADVDDVGGHVAHVAVVGGHADGTAIPVAVEQPVKPGLESAWHGCPPHACAPAGACNCSPRAESAPAGSGRAKTSAPSHSPAAPASSAACTSSSEATLTHTGVSPAILRIVLKESVPGQGTATPSAPPSSAYDTPSSTALL